MNKTTKPTKPLRLASPSKEEQELQIARFLANKKENFFQLILANLLQNPTVTITDQNIGVIVENALKGADIALVKLYPVEKKED